MQITARDVVLFSCFFFFPDNGHSFDQILFYGNEMSLLLFDVLLFCMVDFIWMNYVLDGVITYIITEVCICQKHM